MSDKKTFQILKRPLITEKSTVQKDTFNRLSFEVDRRANKHEIKAAVEQILKVTVLDVRTLTVKGHMRRMGRHKITTSDWKKAIVTIKPGQRVEFFEGA